MSGREVALLLAPAHPKMRVLYLSGYTDAARTLQKPFAPRELVAAMRELLGG